MVSRASGRSAPCTRGRGPGPPGPWPRSWRRRRTTASACDKSPRSAARIPPLLPDGDHRRLLEPGQVGGDATVEGFGDRLAGAVADAGQLSSIAPRSVQAGQLVGVGARRRPRPHGETPSPSESRERGRGRAGRRFAPARPPAPSADASARYRALVDMDCRLAHDSRWTASDVRLRRRAASVVRWSTLSCRLAHDSRVAISRAPPR